MKTPALAFVVAAVAMAGAVLWAMRQSAPTGQASSHTSEGDPAVSIRSSLARRTGDELPSVFPEASPATTGGRFKLVGLVAGDMSTAKREGLALISLDGKPARTFRVGDTVDGNTVLLEVQAGGATIGPRGGGEAISLEISLPPPAATGTASGPTTGSGLTPQSPIDRSVRSQNAPPNTASKYPAIATQTEAVPKNSVSANDDPKDGRWMRPRGP